MDDDYVDNSNNNDGAQNEDGRTNQGSIDVDEQKGEAYERESLSNVETKHTDGSDHDAVETKRGENLSILCRPTLVVYSNTSFHIVSICKSFYISEFIHLII